MGKKIKEYRECDECGGPIESGNPSVRLCKRCATRLQTKRYRDGSRYRSKERKKKKKQSWEEYEEYDEDYE